MTTAAVTPDNFLHIDLDQLAPSLTNPRKHFHDDTLAELAASLESKGMIEPIIVRPRGGKIPYEIVAGERRFRAAKMANILRVPCILRDLKDDEVLEIQVIENLQREDIHPLDEAEGYAALLKTTRLDVGGIAAKIGKSASYVYQRLQLDKLIPAAKKLFFDDTITAGHAVLIARLSEKDQKEVLKECIKDVRPEGNWNEKPVGKGACSVREMNQYIVDNIHLRLIKAPWDVKDANLVPAAGSCEACPKRSGANPLLFPDIKDADTCTDRVCFHTKRAAWLKQREAQLAEEEKLPVVKISRMQSYESDYDNYGENKDIKVLHLHGYVEVKPGQECKSTKVGLVVEGKDRGKAVKVCDGSSCSTHRPRQSSSERPGEKARRLTQANKEQQKKDVRHRISLNALGMVKFPLSRTLLDFIAEEFIGHIYSEAQKQLWKLMGWDMQEAKGQYGFDVSRKIRGKIAKLKDAEVAKLLVCGAVIRHYSSEPWDRGDKANDTVLRAAKIFKINAKKIAREVAKEYAEKAKKSKVAAKSKTKATAKGVAGECRFCHCTETAACMLKGGIPCSWHATGVCNAPKCVRKYDAELKAKAKVKRAAASAA